MSKKISGFALCALLLALSAPIEAQPTKVPRIGYVDAGSPATTGHRAEAFMQGLRELGYVDGRNVVVEYRWADGKLERLPGFLADLVDAKVDVIVSSATPAIRIAQEQTATIPIATYVDKILKGAKPAELPVEQPKKFEL